jgi:NADH-quinone oxidoreductase subunit N
VLFYLIAYLFMNLGAFAVVAFLRNETGSEDLNDFRGLVRRSPIMVLTLSLFLLSLLGIPPLVGFTAKFQIFSVLYEAGQNYSRANHPGLGAVMYGLLVIGGLNTVVSAVYYIKVMKVMILETCIEDVEGREPVPIHETAGSIIFATVLSAAVFALGIIVDPLIGVSRTGVRSFKPQIVNQAAVAQSRGENQP